MRFIHVTNVALPGLLLFASIFLPRPTHSLEIADYIHEPNEYESRDSEFVNVILNLQRQASLRSLQENEACTNACDSDDISNLRASVEVDAGVPVEQQQEEEGGNGVIGRIFGRFAGLFDDNEGVFGRLMNRLFNVFNRRQRDDPKYPVPTESILLLLSKYSTKLKSLAKLIRQESANDAALSKTPDAIQMIYNISAEKVELVATALDPIVDEMQQYATMDVRAISCNMIQILTLLRDVTVPNIESMAKLIYTNSNNAKMKDRFNQYTESSESAASSTAMTTTFSREDKTCVVDASRTTSTSRTFNGLFNLLLNRSIDVGRMDQIISIILLIILFPLSIVGSIIGIIILIVALLAYSIIYLVGNQETDDFFAGTFIIAAILGFFILQPIFIISTVLEYIKEFFADLLDPFLLDRPTYAPFTFTPTPPFFPIPAPPVPTTRGPAVPTTRGPAVPTTTAPAVSVPVVAPVSTNNPINLPVTGRDAQLASEVTDRLSAVLGSPIDTIVRALNDFSDASKEDEDEMDCELAALKCKNDALIDVLPF